MEKDNHLNQEPNLSFYVPCEGWQYFPHKVAKMREFKSTNPMPPPLGNKALIRRSLGDDGGYPAGNVTYPNVWNRKIIFKSSDWEGIYVSSQEGILDPQFQDVSENSGTPKSSILIGFSNKTIHFGVPVFLETPIYNSPSN